MSAAPGSSPPEIRFQGLAVSPGLARGTVYVHRPELATLPEHTVREEDLPAEIARFESALLHTRTQILDMQAKIAEAIGAKDASIFDAHLLVVEDRTLIDEVLRTLQRDRRNIEAVFEQVASRYANLLEQMDDPYLRERCLDVHDVAAIALEGA